MRCTFFGQRIKVMKRNGHWGWIYPRSGHRSHDYGTLTEACNSVRASFDGCWDQEIAGSRYDAGTFTNNQVRTQVQGIQDDREGFKK